MKTDKKKNGFLVPLIVVALVSLAAFIAGQTFGSRRGVMNEKGAADDYYQAETFEEATEEEADSAPWSEDSPSNYADEESLE